ncbi:hypothetical protein P7C70_g4603, partial [Phenoliferia sp. Uapishka_3]
IDGQPQTANFDPTHPLHTLLDPTANTSAAPSPLPTSIDGPPLPKKRKLIKVYNPIRGIYDPETNIPHVYRSTQPTRSSTSQIDLIPHIFPRDDDDEDANGEMTEHGEWKRRREWEKAAKGAGVATVEFVVDYGEGGEEQREELLPGLWDFRKMEDEWLEGQKRGT